MAFLEVFILRDLRAQISKVFISKGDTAKSGGRPASAKAAARERAMRRSVQNNIHYYNMDVK